MKLIGNLSKDDRIIRVVIGLWFISMVYIGPETLWGWLGIVLLATALVGFCPVYKKMGFDTKAAAGENQKTTESSKVAENASSEKAGTA